MDKKKIILCIIVILAAPIFIFFTNHKQNTNITKSKSINDYERSKKVEEFAKSKNEDPRKEITTNEGGYSGINVQNEQALLKVMNTDGMISVDTMLNEALSSISKIHEDSLQLDENSISKYFNDNKDKMIATFGINDEDTFRKLLSDLNFLGAEGKINEAIIEEGSVKKGEFKVNEVRFNLILKSTIGKSKTFNIKFLIQENNQKDNRLIYWY